MQVAPAGSMEPPLPVHSSLPEPQGDSASAAPDQAAGTSAAAPQQQTASPQLSAQDSPSFDSDQENLVDQEAYSLPQQSAANR